MLDTEFIFVSYMLVSFGSDSQNFEEEGTKLMQELQKLFKMLKECNGTEGITEGITQCLRISNGKLFHMSTHHIFALCFSVLFMLSLFQSMNSKMQWNTFRKL